MYNGSNDYNFFRLNPSETVVSRTLQSRYRNFSNVVWRSGKPALDSEWNLINDMTTEMLSSYIQATTPSGWLTLGKNAHFNYCNRPNTFEFYSQEDGEECVAPNCIVNGWPLLVGGVGNVDTVLNSIKLSPAGEDERWDLVFLEVWRAQVRSRDTNNIPKIQNKPDFDHVYKFGNIQFGLDPLEKIDDVTYKTKFFPLEINTYEVLKNGTKLVEDVQYTINITTGTIIFPVAPLETDRVAIRLKNVNLEDDIVDKDIKPSTQGIETSQRIQIQYRIRCVKNVNFENTDSIGFEDTEVQGQGGNANSQISGYTFENMGLELGDLGLWRCGSGSEASRVALQSVDGYSYAIPMFKVYRRNTVRFNDNTNQNGNESLMSSGTSDRPDGKFNDAIDSSDILDLRNKVFSGSVSLEKIMEENLDKLFKGELRTNKLQQIAYNSISNTDVTGYIDFLSNMGTNGKRIFWSDSPIQQDNIFAEVKTSTTNNSLDVYRVKVSEINEWTEGDKIIIRSVLNLPVNTKIKATPRIYLEDKFKTNLSSKGTWTGLDTNEATFTFSDVTGMSDWDIWVYYDISLPEGQGITYVPDEILDVNYTNHSNFPNGNVVRAKSGLEPANLELEITDFSTIFDHPYQNQNEEEIFVESSLVKQRKQIKISPLVQTTSTRNGETRTLEVETLDSEFKTIYVPYPLQHLRGVYTSATGGTELAMISSVDVEVSSLDIEKNQIILSSDMTGDYYVGVLSSLKYDRNKNGIFEELLIFGNGQYGPVFQHKSVSGETIGTRVSLYTTSGELFLLSEDDLPEHFKWSGKKIKVRQGGTGFGFSLNGFIIDCGQSDNNGQISTLTDRQQLWIDCDYLGAPHKGSEIRIMYKYTPYQGTDVGGQDFSLELKRQNGIFFNNGTGGENIQVSELLGTSNSSYTPLSPRLPGSINDYLRNGEAIRLSSGGIKRFESDFWSNANYEVYGYLGGCNLWNKEFKFPSELPLNIERGFKTDIPALEVIFEEPETDKTHAEFVLPILVKNKTTGRLFLLLQIGNKGVHKLKGTEKIFLDFFNLNERILLK